MKAKFYEERNKNERKPPKNKGHQWEIKKTKLWRRRKIKAEEKWCEKKRNWQKKKNKKRRRKPQRKQSRANHNQRTYTDGPVHRRAPFSELSFHLVGSSYTALQAPVGAPGACSAPRWAGPWRVQNREHKTLTKPKTGKMKKENPIKTDKETKKTKETK